MYLACSLAHSLDRYQRHGAIYKIFRVARCQRRRRGGGIFFREKSVLDFTFISRQGCQIGLLVQN